MRCVAARPIGLQFSRFVSMDYTSGLWVPKYHKANSNSLLVHLTFTYSSSSSIIRDDSIRNQVLVFIESPMFWVATFSASVAAIVPDICLYVYNQIVYYRRVYSVIHN